MVVTKAPLDLSTGKTVEREEEDMSALADPHSQLEYNVLFRHNKYLHINKTRTRKD